MGTSSENTLALLCEEALKLMQTCVKSELKKEKKKPWYFYSKTFMVRGNIPSRSSRTKAVQFC